MSDDLSARLREHEGNRSRQCTPGTWALLREAADRLERAEQALRDIAYYVPATSARMCVEAEAMRLVAREALAGDSADKEATCEHHDTHFDRTLCACGAMHEFCNDCGKALFCPWDESQEGAEADRPQDLPVPANADKRYEELDGG